MDRSDLSVSAQQKLPAQMHVVRSPAQPFGNRRRDSTAQFPCSCACKRNHYETIDARGNSIRIPRVDVFHEPFGQHARLSASGSCGYQNTSASA